MRSSSWPAATAKLLPRSKGRFCPVLDLQVSGFGNAQHVNAGTEIRRFPPSVGIGPDPAALLLGWVRSARLDECDGCAGDGFARIGGKHSPTHPRCCVVRSRCLCWRTLMAGVSSQANHRRRR